MVEQATAVEEAQEETMSEAVNALTKKACPKCGKFFKPSGLPGHLRWAHGVTSERAVKLTRSALPDKATAYDRVFELIDKIEKIRERKATLQEKHGSFFTPDSIREAYAALDEQERRLTKELERVKNEKEESVVHRLLSGSAEKK